MAKAVPAINEPFVNSNGIITEVWYKYLLSLLISGDNPQPTPSSGAGVPVFGEFITNRIDTSINGAYEKNGQEFSVEDFTGENNPYNLLVEGKADSIDLNEKVYNMVDIVGSPTLVDGVMSGFSTTNYAEINIPIPRESMEIIIKFNTDLSATQALLDRNYGVSKRDYIGLVIRLNTNGTITTWGSSTGEGWNIFNNYTWAGLTFTANTDWYLKFEFRNGGYRLAQSLDGENWTYSTSSVSALSKPLLMYQTLGCNHYDNNYPLNGSIDFKEFKIILDDKVYWQYEYANEYERQVALTGGCSKFGLDAVNQIFKLPTVKCREVISKQTIGATDITLYSDGYVEQEIKYYPSGTTVGDDSGYKSPFFTLPIEMANVNYEVSGLGNDRRTAFGNAYNTQIINKTTKGFSLGYVVANCVRVTLIVRGYSKDYHDVSRRMIQLATEVSEPKSIETYEARLEEKTNEELNEINQTATEVIQRLLASDRNISFLKYEWDDKIRNDVSWLRADTFSWQDGIVYEGAYQHFVDDIDGKTLQSETVAGITIQYYLADDKHKICPASEELNVLALYNLTGIAWYYILDTVNQKFKLPRTKWGFTGLRDEVGKYVEAKFSHYHAWGYNSNNNAGSFIATDNTGVNVELPLVNNTTGYRGWNGSGGGGGFTQSSAIYNANMITSDSISLDSINTIQPAATQMYLYCYMGDFTHTAIENTAGLNMELFNDKADTNLNNVNNNIDFVIDSQEPTAENNYTWYRLYKSGWVEQGGLLPIESSGWRPSRTINLIIEMANINYSVFWTNGYSGYVDHDSAVMARGTISFTISQYTNYQTNANWEVKGKADLT